MINRRRILIYISGKFSNPKPQEKAINIRNATLMAAKVWNAGFTAITPHINAPQKEDGCTCRYEEFLEGDLELLLHCEGILMLPGWEESPGAIVEHNFANEHSLDIYYSLEELVADH